jgi:type II secretory pathway pseudopilin PulG
LDPRFSSGLCGGFTLLELLVATGAGLVLLSGAVLLFRQSTDLGYVLTQRAEMLQNDRVAIDLVTRDMRAAGTGMPTGGIQLPQSSLAPVFACDFAGACAIAQNTYANARLYALNPGDHLGAAINAMPTDVVTISYRDPASSLDQYPLVSITASGEQVVFDAGTSPPLDDPRSGVQVGDVLVLCNVNGCAAATVTAVGAPTRQVSFAAGDPLHLNQPAATHGNVASLAAPPGSGTYPQTRAFRALIVTYYIDAATDPAAPRLMRHVSASTAVPVAENIENLQISYDTFDENAGAATVNLPDAGGLPNQIRKVNIQITSRARFGRLVGRGFDRLGLVTSISPRNLSFRDRYQ